MPSSENRRRLEVPRRLYDGLKQVAVSEDRTVTSVVTDLLSLALPNYCPPWDPDGHLAARLDGHARRALTLAHEEAYGYGHNYIGTEHLLLGIIREGEGVANVILEKAGALDKVARVRTLALLDRQETDDRNGENQD